MNSEEARLEAYVERVQEWSAAECIGRHIREHVIPTEGLDAPCLKRVPRAVKVWMKKNP